MIAERSRGLFLLHIALQLLAVEASFWLWLVGFRLLYQPSAFALDRYPVYAVLAGVALILQAVVGATHHRYLLHQRPYRRFQAAFVQTLWVAIVLLLFLAAAKDRAISRVFLFSWLPAVYLVLAWTQFVLPDWLAVRLFQGTRVERTVLFGSGVNLPQLSPWLERQRQLGIQVVGLVSDDLNVGRQGDLEVLGGSDDLERLLSETQATQLLVTEFPLFGHVLRFLSLICERRGVRLLIFSDLETKFGHSVTFVEEDGLRFMALREEPLESPFNRLLKRALDLAVAVPAVVLILPFSTVLAWFLQRWQSPGPTFYRQPRAGIQNRPFPILKYRTMHPQNDDVARQASVHDTRIFTAGRWLRKLSIDELPQFINVLRGDMSVVGPRPHLLEHNDQWARIMANYHVRSFVKPGITGLAQVRGFRGEAKTDEALRMRVLADIEYLENWSFTLDCMLIVRTAWQMVFPPKSAY
jgi:exopolysaccharide biosynthesis polyprenyl glycosylphosphotransferase